LSRRPQDAVSSDGVKDCLVQQQLIFGRQLRFAAKQPVYFAHLNSKLFSLGEYVLSSVQSAIDVGLHLSIYRLQLEGFLSRSRILMDTLRVVNVTCTNFAPLNVPFKGH